MLNWINGTRGDLTGSGGIVQISLIMLRSLVRFQLAPLDDLPGRRTRQGYPGRSDFGFIPRVSRITDPDLGGRDVDAHRDHGRRIGVAEGVNGESLESRRLEGRDPDTLSQFE